MKKVFLLILCVFLLVLGEINSQPIKTDVYATFTNFTVENGLSNPVINDIYQDRFGFIWIATDNGLNRFDGHSFVHFLHNETDSLSISSNEITSVVGDNKGNIWVGTTFGLNFYNRSKGAFTRFSGNVYKLGSIKNNHIRKLLLVNDSLLWIETLDGTLTKMLVANGEMQHFKHSPIHQPTYKYHALRTDNNANIWLGGRGIPIYCVNPKTFDYKTFSGNPNNQKRKRDNDLADIIQTNAGTYYVCGTDGFYRFNPNTNEVVKLLASSTYSLVETENRHIILGTGSGLVRYNPADNEMVKYVNDIDNPKSLVNNHVNKVFCDKNNNIWIGTEGGLSFLPLKSNEIEHYFHIPGNAKTLSSNQITALFQDSKKRIWIGTENHGLNEWNRTDNTFRHYLHNAERSNSISSNQISKIIEDAEGNLWIGLWSGVGFNKFEPEKEKFTRFAHNFESKKYDWYSDLHIDKNNDFWLGYWGSMGLQKFDRRLGKIQNYNFFSGLSPTYVLIKQLHASADNSLFVETSGNVLYFYSVDKGIFSAHDWENSKQTNPFINRYFSFDVPLNFTTVYSAATTKNGTSLLATDKGTLVYNAQNKKFTELKLPNYKIKRIIPQINSKGFWAIANRHFIKLSESLIHDTCFTISNKDLPSENTVYNEFKPNVLCAFDSVKLTIVKLAENQVYSKFFPKQALGFNKNQVAFSNNKLLIANNKGLFKVDIENPENNRQIIIKEYAHILQNINFLGKIKNGEFILLSNYGIVLYNAENNTVEDIKPIEIPNGFDFTANAVLQHNNVIYLSTERQIFSLNLQTKQLAQINIPDEYMLSSRLTTCIVSDSANNLWIGTSDNGLNRMNKSTFKFKHFFADSAGLHSNHISCLYVAKNRLIWIGTDKGLCFYNPKNETIIRYSQIPESSQIKTIAESEGKLWVGSNVGLYQIDLSNLNAILLTEADGLPFSDFGKASINLANGNLLMCGNGGIISFSPNHFTKNEVLNQIRISGFYLFGKPVKLNFSNGDTINLSYRQNYFDIHFSDLAYNFPGRNTFAYNITGMGEHWLYTTENSLNFSNLPAGKYIFTITIKGYEKQTEHHAILYINISDVFYKTTWFILANIAVIILVLSIVLSIYIQRINLARKNVILEQRLLSSQMNPHFIFNSLTAIQGFLYKYEAEIAGNYLSDFSRLIRLILDNSRSDLISVEKEVLTLKLYLSLQQLRFSHKFNYVIDIDRNINKKTMYIPPMLAQPFIENSIEHGVMHLPAKGNILVSFKLFSQYILIEIADDGIGIAGSENLYKNKERHVAHATEITRERLANLQKKNGVKYSIEIENRNETEGISGTVVYLKIPYTIKQFNINL